ncbi:MAG: hypothetical protein B7X78_10805, partial [Sphingomonadales bacterium 39-62-4]
FSGDGYELIDHSTNGTFVDGQQARLAGPHPISPGDVFRIGPFEVVAALDDAAAAQAAERNSNPAPANWKGWTGSSDASAPAAQQSSWDARPAGSAISGTGPMSQSWAAPPTAATGAAETASSGGWGAPPPPVAEPPSAGWGAAATPAAPPPASGWGAPTPPADAAPAPGWGVPAPALLKPASEWSSAATPPPPPAADDIWGKFAQSNVVDWARGGFGGASPPPPPAFTPTPPPAPTTPTPQQPVAAPPPAPVPAPVAAAQSGGLATLAQSTGVNPERMLAGEAQTLGMAGNLLRRLVAGMVVMLEARARAKSQLGAQGTSLEFDGNNPLKFARTPEQALEQLLNAPQR